MPHLHTEVAWWMSRAMNQVMRFWGVYTKFLISLPADSGQCCVCVCGRVTGEDAWGGYTWLQTSRMPQQANTPLDRALRICTPPPHTQAQPAATTIAPSPSPQSLYGSPTHARDAHTHDSRTPHP